VTRFVRKWKNRHIRDDDDLDGMNRAEFRELANAISCFQYVPVTCDDKAEADRQDELST